MPVVSLAVLADTDPRFRPEHYQDDLWGCSVNFRFPMVKLIDWDTPERWPALETSDNPFALVVMAQIRAKATKDAETRKAWKFRLIRLIYDRGYARKTIRACRSPSDRSPAPARYCARPARDSPRVDPS